MKVEKDKSREREKLEAILDHFSKATKLSMVAVNTYGEAFLESTNYQENEFCKYVRQTGAGKKCARSYCKACSQAMQWKEPYYFMCHAGLVMWALPLMVDGVSVGAVMCGQVLFWKPDELFFSQLFRSFSQEEIQELRKRADSIHVISPVESDSAAKLLTMSVQYLSNTVNDSLQEQKVLTEWRNVLFERFEARKARFQDADFDLSVYVKRERRYLQYVRMGNKGKIQEMLPLLFTDIEILNRHEEEKIRAWLLDFAALSSRAIIEAGADCQMVFRIMERFKKEMKRQKSSEEMAAYTYQTLGRLFEYIYFAKAGATVEGEVVKIPRAIIERGLETVPKREEFVLYGRTPDKDVHLKEAVPSLAAMTMATHVLDPQTGERRKGTDRDLALMTRILEKLDTVTIASALITPQDVPMQSSDWYTWATSIKNTTKHITGGAVGKEGVRDAIKMASLAVGSEEFLKRPFISFWVLTMPPLRVDENTSNVLMGGCRRQLPSNAWQQKKRPGDFASRDVCAMMKKVWKRKENIR